VWQLALIAGGSAIVSLCVWLNIGYRRKLKNMTTQERNEHEAEMERLLNGW